MSQIKEFDDPVFKQTFDEYIGHVDPSFSMRYGVHSVLFNLTISNHGTPEQVQKYQDDIKNFRILGCFGMTEFGNGSYIQNFETEARFIPETQEFELNSPSLTSLKWWIGMAAETATHCTVFAQLKVKEDHPCGVHIFVVPLRDPSTGKLLPGVSIGDVGAKMGRNGLDNGWIKFTKCRIPRDNMLMRWAQVTPEGEFCPPPSPQIYYFALLGGRVVFTRLSCLTTKKALTIAVRYAAVRAPAKQPILDYGAQLERSASIMAGTFALHFAGNALSKQFEKVSADISDLISLQDFHSISSAMKAYSTWFCLKSLDTCRQTCGGHGYSAYSGLPDLFNDFAVAIPGEGDNTVMAQQTASHLVKSLKALEQGKKVTPSVAYLKTVDQKNLKTDLDDENLIHLLQTVSFLRLKATIQIYDKMQHDVSKKQAWNSLMIDFIRCARVHSIVYTSSAFFSAIRQIPPSASFLSVLKRLYRLFCMTALDEEFVPLLEHNLVPRDFGSNLRKEILVICDQLRPDMVSLVDSFNIPDFAITSALGCYDGNIYQRYFEATQKAPQNSTPEYWDSVVAPLLKKS